MNGILDAFHFLRPAWLLLLPLLAAYPLWLQRLRNNTPMAGDDIAPHLRQALEVPRRQPRLLHPERLLGVLLTLLILIAAGPSWQQQPSPLSDDAVPLVILLDVSSSMNSTDVAPSRLERAKQKIRDIMARVPDKQIALMVFAGSAHVVLPLTPDHEILGNYLAALRTDMMPRTGQFPEYALPGIDQLLNNSDHPADILLITDGARADSAAQMGAWLRSRPHALTVYVIGRDSGDNPVDAATLRALQAATGAALIHDTIDTRDVERIIRALGQRYRAVEDSALPWQDAGYWLVWPAVAMTLLWFRRGWAELWLMFVLLGPIASEETWAQHARDLGPIHAEAANQAEADTPPGWSEQALDAFFGLWLTDNQYGRVLLQLGWFDKASRTFANPLWRATAAYYAGDFVRAAELFARVDSIPARFAAANARAHLRDYMGAMRLYEAVLAQMPDHPGATHNAELVREIIAAINALSASQPDDPGTGRDDLAPEDGAPADGVDSTVDDVAATFTAEQLLTSPELAEQWLRGVQQDPAQFLGSKFATQLEERGVSQ